MGICPSDECCGVSGSLPLNVLEKRGKRRLVVSSLVLGRRIVISDWSSLRYRGYGVDIRSIAEYEKSLCAGPLYRASWTTQYACQWHLVVLAIRPDHHCTFEPIMGLCVGFSFSTHEIPRKQRSATGVACRRTGIGAGSDGISCFVLEGD